MDFFGYIAKGVNTCGDVAYLFGRSAVLPICSAGVRCCLFVRQECGVAYLFGRSAVLPICSAGVRYCLFVRQECGIAYLLPISS